MSKAKKRISIVILVLVILLGVFFSLISFITDYLWFREMGYVDVFFKQLVTELTVGVPTFVIITGLVALYLTRLKKSYFKKIASREVTNQKKLRIVTLVLAVVFGIFATVTTVSNLWFDILKFANSSNFDISDPVFHLDISFYVFRLEFLTQLNEIMIGVIVGFVLLTIVYYMVLLTVRTPDVFTEAQSTGTADAGGAQSQAGPQAGGQNPFAGFADSLFGRGGQQSAQPQPRRQVDEGNMRQLLSIASGKLALLGFIFFLMLGVNFFLRQFDLLHVHTGAVYGAGFTDVNVTLWMYRILCVMSIVAAVLFVVFMKKKSYKRLLTVPVLMIVVGLAGSIAGYVVQNFVVSPDELNKESKYLDWNIQYTQYAYQLDDVEPKAFAADDTLTASDINKNLDTINNIRINDFDPAKQFYNQTQSIRQYYTFNGVDVDRYMINGEYTETFLTTREVDESRIQDTWLNQHIKYTHGYGVAMSRVNKVTPSGQPDVIIGNIPPASEVEEIQITRPEIYFGELSNQYIVVNTDETEFDYPQGDSNVYTHYEGTAGIKMNLLNRLMFSVREGSMRMLVSSNINSNSRIIINRNVMDRVQSIMPQLAYEDDPYMVVDDAGRLFWMVDAYTLSSQFPYAEPFDGYHNYVRNSIKVVVDAYNGNVDFYVVDEEDPIAQTYAKIYPTLFKPFSEMPASLQSHIRYPNNLLTIQASIYGRYHMEDTGVFYLNEDLWDIAYEVYGMERTQMTPNYYIAKLPDGDRAEFFNSIAFTPPSKMNMTALMVARNDGDDYGELVVYQFPKSKVIYGPEQIEAQIDQNTEISKEFSLWNSSGTSYIRGNMFVIPINTSILYMEPIYLEATNSSIPEVKRIVMAYGDKIAYEDSVAECLVSLFGDQAQLGVEEPDGTGTVGGEPAEPTEPGTPSEPAELTQDELIDLAVEALNAATEAQQNGDWAAYGEHLAELQDYLNQLAGE